MANIASQRKRNARSIRERTENRFFSGAVKTHFKRLEEAVARGRLRYRRRRAPHARLEDRQGRAEGCPSQEHRRPQEGSCRARARRRLLLGPSPALNRLRAWLSPRRAPARPPRGSRSRLESTTRGRRRRKWRREARSRSRFSRGEAGASPHTGAWEATLRARAGCARPPDPPAQAEPRAGALPSGRRAASRTRPGPERRAAAAAAAARSRSTIASERFHMTSSDVSAIIDSRSSTVTSPPSPAHSASRSSSV